MSPAVLEIAFAAWGDAYVVAVVEDDGVITEAGIFQFIEKFSDLGVEGRHRVVVDRDVGPNFGQIR